MQVQENKEKVPEDHVKVNGSQSAMFDWLTGPPPPQPSGRPQNSGGQRDPYKRSVFRFQESHSI